MAVSKYEKPEGCKTQNSRDIAWQFINLQTLPTAVKIFLTRYWYSRTFKVINSHEW